MNNNLLAVWCAAMVYTKYTIRKCSICDYPITFQVIRWSKGYQLVLDTGCDCVTYEKKTATYFKDLLPYLEPANGHVERILEFIKSVQVIVESEDEFRSEANQIAEWLGDLGKEPKKPETAKDVYHKWHEHLKTLETLTIEEVSHEIKRKISKLEEELRP